MDIKKKIGARIRYLRKREGLSQEKLALKAEMDRTYIASVESGERNISIVNIYKISTALNISLKEFFSEEI